MSKAQDFPLLLIDSTYYESNTVNTSTGIIDSFYAFTGYSYDEDDRLVQTRRRTIINSYTYLPNLTIINSESKNSDGDWEVRGRTTINEEGDIKTTTVEIINNGAWLNLVKGTVFYNAEGYDSLTLTDVGINGEWVQESSRKKYFDAEGHIIREEGHAYDSELEQFVPQSGYVNTYYQDGRTKTNTTLRVNASMEFEPDVFTDNIRDTNGLLSIIIECVYDENGDCLLSKQSTYDRTDSESYTVNFFNRVGTEWEKWRSRIYFYGPMVYSAQPDSSLIYNFSPDNPDDSLLFIKYYYSYELLPDGRLFNRTEFHKLDEEFDNGFVRSDTDHFFWIQEEVTNIDEPTDAEPQISVYPNPVKRGRLLNIDADLSRIDEVEIYDLFGRLVKTMKVSEGMNLFAPSHEGMYTILFKKNRVLVGISKQMVER